MAIKFAVGIHLGNKRECLIVEAEDALIAGLRAKYQYPEAIITYIRKQNKRGDVRHPHEAARQAPKTKR